MWQQAFSEKNITSTYKKTGIFPFKPELLLHTINKHTAITTLLEPSLKPPYPKTPLTSLDVQQLQRQYCKAPSSALIIKVFNANATLAAQHSIDTHTIYALQIQLANERKKRSLIYIAIKLMLAPNSSYLIRYSERAIIIRLKRLKK